MTVAPAPASTGQVAPDRVPRLSYFFPGPQRGGQPRGAGRRGARGPARDRRPVRDHRRRRRLEGPDGRDRRPARRRAPGRRAGRPPRGEPRLRRRAAVGLRGVALRAPRVHRRRPPVPRRRPRPADGPARRGGPARTSSSATGSSAPTRSIRIVYARTYKLANRIFFGLKVRDVDCACKLFRREALEGVRVESGGAFFSAELLIKVQAAGRSVAQVGIPHYPRTAGSPTGAKPSVSGARSRTSGACACGCGRTASGRAGAAGRSWATEGAFARPLARGPAAALVALDVQRVDELAEDREPRLVEHLVRRLRLGGLATARRGGGLLVLVLGRRRRRRAGSRPGRGRRTTRRPARPSRTASAIASDGRASISCRSPSRLSTRRAWYVSSARSVMTIRSTRTSSVVSTVANRSWVSGRSGVRPWSFIAIALASHGPTQTMSRRPASISRRTRTWRPVGMCTRTLSTIISISVPRSPSMRRLSHGPLARAARYAGVSAWASSSAWGSSRASASPRASPTGPRRATRTASGPPPAPGPRCSGPCPRSTTGSAARRPRRSAGRPCP